MPRPGNDVLLRRRLEVLESLLRTQAAAPTVDPVAWAERASGLKLDPWQCDLIATEPEDTLIVCSRQVGKSTSVALAAGFQAAMRGARVLVLAPTLRQSSSLFEKITDYLLRADPPVRFSEKTKTRLRMPGGGVVVCAPGDQPDFVRGLTVEQVLIDEAGYVRDQVWAVVSPMLATTHGTLVGLTTPAGMRGSLYSAWSSTDPWRRVRVTASECPRISPEFLEKERARLGELLYRQEYFCEFVAAAGGYFRPEDLAALFDTAEDDGPAYLPDLGPDPIPPRSETERLRALLGDI